MEGREQHSFVVLLLAPSLATETGGRCVRCVYGRPRATQPSKGGLVT